MSTVYTKLNCIELGHIYFLVLYYFKIKKNSLLLPGNIFLSGYETMPGFQLREQNEETIRAFDVWKAFLSMQQGLTGRMG